MSTLVMARIGSNMEETRKSDSGQRTLRTILRPNATQCSNGLRPVVARLWAAPLILPCGKLS